MCLIIFATNAHPRYKLILAANRDEFYARPTAPAAFWTDAPQILAGKDLAAGGTWLGITETGRFAAVTNYRDPSTPSGKKSRGDLTKDYLAGDVSPADYLRRLEKNKAEYSGFNLLVGDFGGKATEIFYFSHRAGNVRSLPAGIYGLSNALLDISWHKVETSKRKLTEILGKKSLISPADLFPILADRKLAPDETLPDTGVGIERERVLSPAFIATSEYGTRSSTVLLIGQSGEINFTEKTFVGAAGVVNYKFSVEE